MYLKPNFSLHDETKTREHSIFGYTFNTFHSFTSVTLEVKHTYSHIANTHGRLS
jgi:hypothetical protein